MSDGLNPYASPQQEDAPSQRRAVRFGRPYMSGHVRAMVAVTLLALGVLANCAMLASNTAQYRLLSDAKLGVMFTPAEANANDSRQQQLIVTDFVMLLLSAIAFLVWVYRAHANLTPLGNRHLDYTPGGAVGWYFCPIASYFKPYFAMREIAVCSDPEQSGPLDDNFRAARNLPLLPWWWGGFVIMSLMGTTSRMFVEPHSGIDGLISMTGFNMAQNVVAIVTALLLILVILGVDKRQDERFRRICERGDQVYVPQSHVAGGQIDNFLDSLQ